MRTTEGELSASEVRTLGYLVEDEHFASELDWVAFQRLKRLGLVEERATGVSITKQGRSVLDALEIEVLQGRA